jgi:hypothetical protein
MPLLLLVGLGGIGEAALVGVEMGSGPACLERGMDEKMKKNAKKRNSSEYNRIPSYDNKETLPLT